MAGREDRKAELIAQLSRARAGLDRASAQVREAVDVPRRLRRSVANNMFLWLGGAALVGVVIAKLPRRTQKVLVDAEGQRVDAGGVAKTGLLLAVAKIAFDVARPTLLKLAAEQLGPLLHRAAQRWQRRGEK